jgi:hypothetical protein
MYCVGYSNGTEYYYVPGGGRKKKSPRLSEDARRLHRDIKKTKEKIEKYREKIESVENIVRKNLETDLINSKLVDKFLKTEIDLSKRQLRRELTDKVRGSNRNYMNYVTKVDRGDDVPRAELNKYLDLLVDLEIEKYNYKVAEFYNNFNKSFEKQKIKALEKILTRGIERKKRHERKLLEKFFDDDQLDKLIKY